MSTRATPSLKKPDTAVSMSAGAAATSHSGPSGRLLRQPPPKPLPSSAPPIDLISNPSR
jgi:hypothetical protein